MSNVSDEFIFSNASFKILFLIIGIPGKSDDLGHPRSNGSVASSPERLDKI